MANIIYLAKGGFLFTLTTVHFIFFGLPALERFLEHQVSVKKIVQHTKSLLPPAVLELEKVFRSIKCFLNLLAKTKQISRIYSEDFFNFIFNILLQTFITCQLSWNIAMY